MTDVLRQLALLIAMWRGQDSSLAARAWQISTAHAVIREGQLP
jgi:hypothetical protein